MKSINLHVLSFILVGSIFLNTSVVGQIPTISIQTNEEIMDEPKVPGIFTYTGVSGEIITSNIGIEIRGGFSQSFPKKTYDIEFWNDPTGDETLDVQLGSLRKDDDWILDAMYNEPLRINSFLAHKLWLDMNTLYYQEDEPNAKSGADVMYVEVTINGDYQGIYLLSEQVDRSQLKLNRNSNTEIRGELYKAYDSDDATFFNDPDEVPNNNSSTWSGYEYRYPNDIVDWTNVSELIDFVANSSDEDFANGIGNRFDINNLMDYFILLNIARILDNRGKNIYLCRYDAGEPYFLTPWDLDGSWGLLWDGSNDTKTEGPLSNNLFDRLIETDAEDFRQRISNRWNDLRGSILNDDELEDRINTAHQFLGDNQSYEKEETVWEYDYSDSDLDYLFGWLEDRLEFLDLYFNDITSVSNTNLVNQFRVYPNPAHDHIVLSFDSNHSKSINIYDVMGVRKLQFSSSEKSLQFDISDFAQGVYIIELDRQKQMFYKL